jgi:hypothetical protein
MRPINYSLSDSGWIVLVYLSDFDKILKAHIYKFLEYLQIFAPLCKYKISHIFRN